MNEFIAGFISLFDLFGDFIKPWLGHHIGHVTAVLVELSIAAVVVVLVKRDEWNKAFEETNEDRAKAKAFIEFSNSFGFSEQAKQVVAKQLNGKSKGKNYPYFALALSMYVLIFMSFHINYLSSDLFLLVLSTVSFIMSIAFSKKEYENSQKIENEKHQELKRELVEQQNTMNKMSESFIMGTNKTMQ